MVHDIKFVRDHWPVYGMSKHERRFNGVNMSVTIKLPGCMPTKPHQNISENFKQRIKFRCLVMRLLSTLKNCEMTFAIIF